MLVFTLILDSPKYCVHTFFLYVKCSQILKFMLKVHTKNKSMPWVIRVKRKLRLWYSEQQVNSCYGIYSNKEFHAKGNSSNKQIYAPVLGTNILEPGKVSQVSQPNLKN